MTHTAPGKWPQFDAAMDVMFSAMKWPSESSFAVLSNGTVVETRRGEPITGGYMGAFMGSVLIHAEEWRRGTQWRYHPCSTYNLFIKNIMEKAFIKLHYRSCMLETDPDIRFEIQFMSDERTMLFTDFTCLPFEFLASPVIKKYNDHRPQYNDTDMVTVIESEIFRCDAIMPEIAAVVDSDGACWRRSGDELVHHSTYGVEMPKAASKQK